MATDLPKENSILCLQIAIWLWFQRSNNYEQNTTKHKWIDERLWFCRYKYFNLAFGFIEWFSIFLILIQKPQTKLNHWTGFRLQSLIKSKFIKRSHSKLMDLIEMQWIIYAKRAHIVCAQYRKIGMFHIIRSLILM